MTTLTYGDVPTAAAAASPRTGYAGLVTRTIAFAIDAAIVNGAGAAVAVVVALGVALLRLPDDVETALAIVGAALFVCWSIGYFVAFWSTTGQTPGSRVMRIRVRRGDGERLRPRTALVRIAGMWIAALPLFLGYAPILFDSRRRGLHDRLARTVVVHDAAD